MPCQIDVVTIKFGCKDCHFIIQKVNVVGSAAPCKSFLVVGKRVADARRCLLRNGFVLVKSCNHVFIFERRRFF